MSTPAALGLAVLLLAGNAFFVGAEFALISARRSRIEPMAEAGRRGARATLRAMERVSLMMAGAQLGITVCSLGLGAVGEPAVAHLIEPAFAALGLPEQLLPAVAFVIAMTVVVFLHMVVGEMVPKNLALAGPERSAVILGPALALVVRALRPLIWLLNVSANAVLRLLRVTPRDEVASAFTSDEVAAMIAESRREGLLDRDEERLLHGALEFHGVSARDLALPLQALVTVPAGITPAEVEDVVARTGCSRLPVTAQDGSLAGYLHVKDVLHRPDDPRAGQPVPPQRLRPLPAVGAGAALVEVVATLLREGSHLARVVDPTGPVIGVLALEDALERFIGEVEDPTHA